LFVFSRFHALDAAVGMADIQAVPVYILDPQTLYFPGAQARNRRKQIRKPGTFVLPGKAEKRRRLFRAEDMPFRRPP
jgi:hypothetical protein